MATKVLGVLMLCVCSASAAFLCCFGCTLHKTGDSSARHLEALRKFVEGDTFRPRPGTLYPEPHTAPDHLLKYAARRYDSDCDVRRLLAYYFLRYDSVLIDRWLIAGGGDSGTLLALLWEKEAKGWIETPSAEMMRGHIASSTQTLCLGSIEKEQLAINQAKAAKMYKRWDEKAKSDGLLD